VSRYRTLELKRATHATCTVSDCTWIIAMCEESGRRLDYVQRFMRRWRCRSKRLAQGSGYANAGVKLAGRNREKLPARSATIMSNVVVPMVPLNNGVAIPQVGLGVFQTKEGAEVERAVDAALEAGYRLIDTAAIYGNEVGVGKAIKASGLPREEIFITTKLWNAHHAYEDALRAFDESLDKLDCGYIDLYLIHWPLPMEGKFTQAWKALEELYTSKRVRAIGVSNFKPHHLETLLGEAETVPAVNQIELHPLLQQQATRAYCMEHGIAIESYSPLMQAGEALEHPVITNLAQKYGKTTAQVILRWHAQSGFIVIPKSVKPERIRENIALFDFALSEEDMRAIEGMDRDQRIGADPDTASFK
jgi:diketogulonate reductase-like aldo/keto reductase